MGATGADELTFAVTPLPPTRRTSSLLPNMMRAKLRFDMTASKRSSQYIVHLSILRLVASKGSQKRKESPRR